LGNVYLTDSGNNAVDELPRAFVSAATKSITGNAGSDVLPAVLPTAINLLPPFAPTSDQSWLTINGATNGVISFSFSENPGTSSRTANITVLGQTVPVVQAVPVPPPLLFGMNLRTNGVFQFSFSNLVTAATFTVLGTTNLTLPLAKWTVLGAATNTAPGLYQFATGPTTNKHQSFYQVRSP
jgi:hypothetical protein